MCPLFATSPVNDTDSSHQILGGFPYIKEPQLSNYLLVSLCVFYLHPAFSAIVEAKTEHDILAVVTLILNKNALSQLPEDIPKYIHRVDVCVCVFFPKHCIILHNVLCI